MRRVANRYSAGCLALLVCVAAPCAIAGEQDRIDFANGLFSRGFYEEAAEEYRSYLDDFPDGAHRYNAWFRLGEAELAAGRNKAARVAFDQVLSASSDTYRNRAQLRRAVATLRLEQYEDAEAGLSAAAADPALAAEANYYLQKVYLATGRVTEAERALEKLTEIASGSPLVPYARYQLAFAYLNQERFEQAAVQFSSIADSGTAPEELRVECRFRAAETYDRLGWFDAAVSAYETLRSQYPDSEYAARAEYGYAWSLYHAGKYPEAEVVINRLIAQGGDSGRIAGLQYLLANAMQSQGRYAEAVQAYKSIREANPGSEVAAKAHYKLAWTHHLAGDDNVALGELSAFLTNSPEPGLVGDAAYLRGEILAGQGEYGDAYEEFRLVASEYPGSEFAQDALFKAGECLSLMNRPTEALATFRDFTRTYPDHELAPEAQLRAGNAAMKAGDLGNAIDLYTKIDDMNPPPPVEEEALYRLGIAMHNASNYRVSAETFLKLVEKYPDSKYRQQAHLRIGDAYLRDAADPVRAVEHYQQALKGGGPYAGEARRGLALARYETKDYEGATQDFLDLIRAYPEVRLNAATLQWLGKYRLNAQDWQGAIDAYRAFRNHYPEHTEAGEVAYLLGEAYVGAGQPEQAIESYARVAELSSNASLVADAQLNIAQIHEDLGHTAKAVQLYEEAASANAGESAARARFRLGELAEAQGEHEAAARHFMRVAILFLHEELTPESLLRAAKNYEQAGDLDRAERTRKELQREFPDSAQAATLNAAAGSTSQ